jgi:nucleoid-associated protein EbfC
MNMMKMMKQAQQMQEKMRQMQEDLIAREYSAEAGGGMVKVRASGGGVLLEVKIDPAILRDGDAEMVEDLVVTAVNDAIGKGKEEMQAELGKLSAGLGLPGLGM